MKAIKIQHIGILIVIGLTILVSATGLFLKTEGMPREFVNQYGDTVRLAGQGLYANDSYFKAPIFQATDLVMLFVAVPLLLISLLWSRRRTLRGRFFHVTILGVFVYYSANLAFGVTFNTLHLAYIALFSSSLFCMVHSVNSLLRIASEQMVQKPLPYRGLYTFLSLSGIALVIAWLPDILSANLAGRPLALIEVYTTEITYVLDMGVIGPMAIVALFLLRRRRSSGYVMLGILLMLCAVIGVMLPVQTLMQAQAGIILPVPVLVTKIGIFCILAGFAIYFFIRLLASLNEERPQPALQVAITPSDASD